MTLEQIFGKYGIRLKNENGELRNVIDIIEDMYLKLNTSQIVKIMIEISEEERYNDIFDTARNRRYEA